MKIIDRTRNGVTFLSADGFEAAGGVAHGFSTRLGGVIRGVDSEAAGAPRVAVTALEATGVA